MPTALDHESKLIIDATLQRFVDQHYDFSTRHQRLAKPLDCQRYWPTLAELGLLSLPLTEEQGGLGGHAQDIADAVTALARGLILEPFGDCAVLAANLLATDADSADEVQQLIAGELLSVVLGGRPGAQQALRAQADGGGYRLHGVLNVQPYAEQADQWLLVAEDEAGQALVFKLAPDAGAAHLHGYRLLDDRPAADVSFNGEAVLQPWLQGKAAEQALARVQGLAASVIGADAVGVMQALLRVTGEYLVTRKQFGVPLASFQALQHRYADMHMSYLETRAIAGRLTLAVEQAADEVAGLSRALLSVLLRTAARLGHEAIQMHGGMGATDELVVSHYNNRLVVLVRQLEQWVQVDAELHQQLVVSSTDEGGFDEVAFRAQIRDFVETHLDAQTRHKVRNGLYLDKHDYVNWQQALRRQGWFGAAWPERFGGQDWSVRQEHVFLQECAINAAPMLIPYGVNMLGPVLHEFGTERQRERYLPGILDSETWWCQGYSEPNAGSDLASLNTSAVREGDHYLVNGTKMWTTEAHWADMMHCLVRTDRSGKKQQGISFLLIDMRSPGITVEPIVTLDGVHHTNQVFFDSVRVPVENLVGDEGDGWKIAKFLLARERGFIADTGNKLRMLAQIRHSFERFAPAHPTRNALMRERLFEIEAALTALVALEHDYVEAWMRGEDDGVGASVLKVRGTEVLQQMTEYWRDLLGAHGACYDPTLRKGGAGLSADEPWVQAASINYAYLYGRCWSIFGGTNEVQRNIIAASVLRG